ncbi:hypothetical protein PV327_010976 [Microctonus hyperodae]|uniref:Uncharacterized protein n=1 Tax=Microctonus hyperodae TaxID=165561 RepID=A0AA39C8P1_MICHY|nr:hypothetical protein PV327_010976 [Microctonus hyperodae]
MIKKEICAGLHSTFSIKCNKCALLSTVDTVLSKVLACVILPNISNDLYKRCQRKVGPVIEAVAKDSCKSAAEEERELFIKKIDELCEKMPGENVAGTYPFHQNLHSYVNSTKDSEDTEVNVSTKTVSNFDQDLGEIINIIVSYDMGWSKRAGNRSILKESRSQVRILIGDEDSSTISAVRKGIMGTMYKLSDSNHFHSYAIAQNKDKSRELAVAMLSMSDHLFERHKICGSCSEKFCIAASSQANESLNNIMAHKAPKNCCYSCSESTDYRYASAICTRIWNFITISLKLTVFKILSNGSEGEPMARVPVAACERMTLVVH